MRDKERSVTVSVPLEALTPLTVLLYTAPVASSRSLSPSTQRSMAFTPSTERAMSCFITSFTMSPAVSEIHERSEFRESTLDFCAYFILGDVGLRYQSRLFSWFWGLWFGHG